MSSNSITQVETFGFERIPDRSLYARSIDLFRLLFGGCNTFSTSVPGSFPVLPGLSFKAGVRSIVQGRVQARSAGTSSVDVKHSKPLRVQSPARRLIRPFM